MKLDNLKKYFGQANILHKVRTDFAFHYSPQNLDDMLVKVPDELDIYLEDGGNANTLYYFAEALANHAVLESVSANDKVGVMEQFKCEVVEVANYFTRFGQGFMSCVIRKHGDAIWKERSSPVKFEELPSFAEMTFPWFTDTSKGLRRAQEP